MNNYRTRTNWTNWLADYIEYIEEDRIFPNNYPTPDFYGALRIDSQSSGAVCLSSGIGRHAADWVWEDKQEERRWKNLRKMT